jgi:DNA-binding NarL/FixJ family response regulator
MDGKRAITVFLVDSNSTFLRIIEQFLREQDALEVVGATPGGVGALGQIKALQPDLVLIDPFAIDAPGLEGVAHVREAVPQAAIIVTTLLNIDGGRDGYRQAVLGAGADDFVPKDSLAADLLPAISRVLDRNGCLKKAAALLGVRFATA